MPGASDSDERRRRNRTLFEEMLRRLGSAQFEAACALLAEDVRCDWPYPPTPQGPEELVGRQAVRAFFEGGMSAFAPYRYTIERIYDLVDPDTLIAEYSSHTQVLADGQPYENRYLGIIRFAGGVITYWREYINPVPVLAILDRVRG
jgi:uncharacterized protein